MDLLLSVPEALGRRLLAGWLEVKSVVRLDQAYQSHQARKQFHALLCGSKLSARFERTRKSPLFVDYCEWLGRRRVTPVCVGFPLETSDEIVCRLEQFLEHSCSGLEELCVHDFQADCTPPWLLDKSAARWATVDRIIQRCYNLTALSVTGCFDVKLAFLQKVAQFCPNLRALNVPAGIDTDNNENTEHGFLFPELQSLTLTGFMGTETSFDTYVQATSHVEKLTLEVGVFVWETPLPNVWTNLKELHMTNFLHQEALISVLVKNPHLAVLVLKTDDRSALFTDGLLHCLAAHCTQLTWLTVHSPHFTDAAMSTLVQELTQLKRLNLDLQSDYFNLTYQALATRTPLLTSLTLLDCWTGIAEVRAILAGCPQLKEFVYTIDEDERRGPHVKLSKVYETRGVSLVSYSSSGY